MDRAKLVSECLWLILFIDLSRFILYFKNCKYLEISFQITNQVFKSQIKFSNHKSSAKSVCFQITYIKFTSDGPLELKTHGESD